MERESARESWSSLLLPVALVLGLVLLLNLPAEPPAEPALINPLEPWLKILVGYLAAGAEIAAALVIGVAVLRAIVTYVRQAVGRAPDPRMEGAEAIRLRLGRMLALGLEFTVASDILRTAVAPTRQDILNLAAIVLLRTLLNYFLEREIRQGRAAQRDAAADD